MTGVGKEKEGYEGEISKATDNKERDRHRSKNLRVRVWQGEI